MSNAKAPAAKLAPQPVELPPEWLRQIAGGGPIEVGEQIAAIILRHMFS